MTRSKSTTALLSVAILVSSTLVPAAFAAPMSYEVPHDNGIYDGTSQNFWGGNASEIPRVVEPGAHAMYEGGSMPAQARIGTAHRAPRMAPESHAMSSSSNSAMVCDHGYRWDETAANGWTLPMPCHS